ncbi:chitobiase/beta-hexosaminidase C-terminal domain-containing protein [Paenibacillus radicis (ex Xue et al. 2023)]|uniref:Chitobiase/beta-hexosaminidase C-terminal domain-containing protein n=1 Tax=Paenibacillus radicis (ex Xue et al. 2023) TaxID=2972489 RepID=A0ABT1YTK1_9BACL|nr:chitobiase/beta-hexosaminidase C-terminal domain-containing protein [Paenibacillus radicis (ex Xue et al. 2023)]MCR8636517.1 chitobiase/beta-hexosaminidase C-terminal domain-containing protein [Paenibacillus radicis (ex Xue et al. 2023)]
MAPKQKAIFGSAFIALLIAVLTFSLVFMANASSDKWTDHADTLWYDPVYNTFKIDTSAKLAGVAKLVNDGRTADGAPIYGFSGKVLEIDRDLDLAAYQWVPIGSKAAPFKGTLIAKGGQTYKISGMKVSGDLNYAGLVGYMDGATVGGFEFTATGSIDVVTVSNSVYNNVYGDNGVYVGSAVGKMINNSTVYNITNQLNVKVSTTITNVFAGGIVGSGEGSISNSNNNKPVTASGMDTHAGGIVGYGDDDGLKIKKVMNNGPIDATGSGKLHAGGIAGFAYGFIKMDEDATPISNSASIKVTGGSGGYAGGIVGRAGADITFSNNTTNTGAVSIDSPQASGTYAGGLAGAITAEQTQPTFSIVFTNSAAITNKGGTNVHTGGIAGFVGSTFKWDKSFTNNVSITAAGTQQLYSGGLIGKVSGDIYFNSAAKNTGVISVSGRTVSQKPDEAFTGGIIGFANKRVLFESSTNRAYENSAEITVNGGTGLYTGGIVSNRAYARASGAVSNNVYSIAKIAVNGQSKLYTGGFIGLVPDEGVDKVISGAEFASEIAVTGAASDPSNTISTGGIVGYYVNRSGAGSIDKTKFQGVISAVGGAETYTGGIAGYMDGGTLSQATVGNTGTTEIPFAAITAEGTIGGVAGYSKGTISGSTVKFIALTNKLSGGFTGGVAGKAQGTISNAAVGVESYADGYSVKLESTADTVTAGGIAGHNDNALNVTGSAVTNIGLINELGRNGYTLGGVAGFLSADAIIGEPGTPIKVSKLAIDIKSANSQIGGAIGINHSPKVYVQSENLTINIAAVQAKVGGISGIQEVTKGSIPSDVSTNAAHPLKAKGITITAQGNNARIGGLFGENLGDTPRGFAHNVSITTEGASNQIGGIAGRNTGSITSNEARNIIIASKGTGAEAGGIAGRSEAADSTVAPALIVNSSVYAEEEPLITATGASAFIGGIVGMAKSTEITNPVLRAEAPDYAMLVVKAEHVIAGGIAGQIEQGKIVGDATMTNVENLMVSTSTDAPNAYVGGISGYNLKSRMERIVAINVNLIINGEQAIVGGMAGYNQSTATAILVNNYIAQLNLKVNASAAASTIGGIIGVNDKQSGDPSTAPGIAVSTIQNSRYVGSIQAFSPSTVTGGMVGENRSLIANNSITDKIPVSSKGNDSTLGGLVGLNTETGTLYYTYSNANLTIEGENTLAGGLVGYNKGQVITSYVDIDIASRAYGTDGNSVFLGGLIGRNSGTIEKSYSASKVTAAGVYTNVGGLIGDHVEGSITDSYAAKEVIASANGSYAGGLLGRIANGKVTTSYSAGQVTAGNGAYAGGFAGRYDNPSKELLYKNYYVKDENEQINNDLPDFAEGDHRWLLVHVRLSTILSSTLKERDIFPGLSGWDFTQAWKYGSLNADYKYPELHRSANTGGDGGSGNDVNANINWYMRDKGAINFDIKTEAELAGLAAIVNGAVTGVEKFAFEGRTIRVLNPIHIQSNQWVPIGNNEANAFLGTFEGNNYLIDGLKLLPDQSYSGLFGVIGQGAKVQHMRLEPLSVAGNQYTGVLAGLNKGTVSQIEVKLLNAGTISGNIVGGIIGKNAGALEKLSMTLDGNSRIEAVGNNAVAGGIIGDNTFALNPQVIDLKTPSGSIGSSAANATIGGIIGKQTGDFKGFRTAITAAYPISSTGANSTVGGLIGNHVSGKADDLIVTFTDGTLQALGLGSTLGGATGLSDAGNLISNVNITASQAGQHMTGNGIVGGVVGVKTGKGTNAFDMENVKTDKVVLSSLDGSTNSVIGGIAGKLSQTAVHQAVFSAFIRGKGDRVTAGGIIGYGMDSILYQVDVLSDITSVSRAGESAVGGVAGIMQSSNVDAGLDFGKLIPFYRGIYDAVVHSKAMEVKGADNGPDLYVGGVVGKNMAASIYNSRSTSDLAVNGAKIASVGGVAGYSDGIIVSSSASSNINADASTIYDVGGVVGWTAGGAIHYSNMNASGGQKITVGSAITKPGVMPATRVGGFAGNGDNTNITHSFANIPVIVVCTNQENTIYAGGFAGLLGDLSSGSGLIQQVYAKGIVDVKGITGSYAGGFAGSIDHYSITDAYATGSITNTGFDTSSGGFAGAVERRGIVKNTYAIQDKVATIGINHATRSYGGGFVGYNDGTLDGVFAKVAELSMSVSGANAYKGSLVGYNFRDGKIVQSSYVGALNAVGYNLGSTPGVVQADSTNSYAFGNWNFETDPSFLSGNGASDIVINNAKQLTGAITLYNNTGLDYYRLFNRTATQKPAMDKFTLGADLDLTGISWTSFASFQGEFDGKGKKVKGLKLVASGSDLNGFVSENYGKISNLVFDEADITAGSKTGVAAGINHAGATISDIVIRGKVKGNDYVGGAVGDNKGTVSNVTVEVSGIDGVNYVGGITGANSGSISGAAVKGAITGSGSIVGGISGSNEGQLSKAYSRGTVRATTPGLTVAAGGIAGENKGSGSIAQSFSYSDIDAASSLAQAGGITGTNEGTVSNTYASGRVKAEGTVQAKAGGIAGYAVSGTINYSLNYGEVIAGIEGKIIQGKVYFGGIAGHKEDAAVVSHTAFNKQMLKSNSAYYNTSGNRVAGDDKEASGMLATELTKGTLPAGFEPSLWKADQGFYPQLSAFNGTAASKLSAAAVVLSKTDLINLIRTGFDLTKDGAVVWSANPNEASISDEAGNVKGSLKTAGSAILTVSSNGESRTITVNAPSMKYNVAALKPKFSPSELNFTDQVTVTLSTDEPGGKIYYTLDGSQPDAYSTLYTGPIIIRITTNFKAVTVIDEKENSEILSGIWVRRESNGSGGGGGGGGGLITPAAPQPTVTAQVGQTTVKGNTDSSTSATVAMNSKLKLTAPEGQIIYYTTDGSTPTTSSAQYIGEIIITGNMTIKLITDKDDRVITMNYQAENAKYDLKSDAGQIKYISGYEDGQFKPDAALTRYDLIHVLAPLLNMEEVSVQNRFKDVKSGIEDLVAFFTSAGIVDGYPDGTFGGEKGLSRAEFVVLMSRVLKLDITSNGETSLSDVRGHWSEKYVNAFTKAGYVQGFPDGTFEPDSQISRAQAIVVINRITGAQKQTLPSKFSDLTPDHWAFDDIMPVVK